MFRGKCLHPQLSRIMAETGHTDTLCVTDAGFPMPMEAERVDLAWEKGKPGWLEVCQLIRDEMVIEKIYLAEEIKEKNPAKLREFQESFSGIPIVFVAHSELKKMSHNTRAVVRTGEFSSFCNCIFVAGVDF